MFKIKNFETKTTRNDKKVQINLLRNLKNFLIKNNCIYPTISKLKNTILSEQIVPTTNYSKKDVKKYYMKQWKK